MSTMSKRPRQARPRPALRKRGVAPAPATGSPGWLLGAGVAVIAGVALLAAVFASTRGSGLPGLQTGPPPWLSETAQLRARLNAIGLSALTAEGQVQHTHQHLDLFVDGEEVEVPAGIGIDRAAAFLAPDPHARCERDHSRRIAHRAGLHPG